MDDSLGLVKDSGVNESLVKKVDMSFGEEANGSLHKYSVEEMDKSSNCKLILELKKREMVSFYLFRCSN